MPNNAKIGTLNHVSKATRALILEILMSAASTGYDLVIRKYITGNITNLLRYIDKPTKFPIFV